LVHLATRAPNPFGFGDSALVNGFPVRGDHEDFFEVWAVASEKNGRRVERLRHEAQRFRPTLKVNTGVANCLDESGKSAFADHVQCPLLQCRLMTSR